MGKKPTPAPERFWRKVDKTDGCWLWTAALERGYGKFMVKWGEGMVPAHRYAYELTVGPIPDGMHIDHLCHTADAACPGGDACQHRRCVNPAHLEPVTQRENLARGFTRKTHCKRGHAYAEHLAQFGRYRACGACRRLYNSQAWRKARRAERNAA